MLETRSRIFIRMQMTSKMKVPPDNRRVEENLTRPFPRQVCQPWLGVGNLETVTPRRNNETESFIILNEEETNYFHRKYLIVISCRSPASPPTHYSCSKVKISVGEKIRTQKKRIGTKSFTAARSDADDSEEGSDPVTFTL